MSRIQLLEAFILTLVSEIGVKKSHTNYRVIAKMFKLECKKVIITACLSNILTS